MTLIKFKKWAPLLALLFMLQPLVSRAQGGPGTAWGTGTAIGIYSTAFGQATMANQWWGGGATAFGNGTLATGEESLAFGYQTTASVGGQTTAFGYGSAASGGQATAFGAFTNAIGVQSLATGGGSTAIGDLSTAMNQSYASGPCSDAFGVSNSTGYASMAWNQGCAWGYYTTAFGTASTATGTNATAFGSCSHAYGNNSTATGCWSLASSFDAFAIGAYNVGGGDPINWVGTDPLFEVGNGVYPNLSDALVVYKNGNTVVSGTLSVSGTSNAVLINPVGDLSMGPFTNGPQPQ